MNLAAIVWLLLAGLCFGDDLSEALRAHRYEDALAQAAAALRSAPRDPRLWTARGLALAGLNRTQDSLSAFSQALELAADFAPALMGAAEVAYRARDPRAAGFLERLIRLEPTNGTAHAMAGALAFESGDCPSAVRHFESARREVEANSQAHRLYGECLLKLDRGADAVSVFERLTASRGDASMLPLLASAQLSAGQTEAAVSTARRAIAMAPDSEQGYVEMASIFLLRDANRAALMVVEAGLARLPRSARLYGLRGVAEAADGLDEQAARDFEKSNELDPAKEYGAAGFGVLYATPEHATEASAILRRRLQKDPDDATLNYLLAQALTREGAHPGTPAFQEAREALLRSLSAAPDYAAAHTALGKLYVRAGEDARAITEFERAATLSPSDRAALSQLAAALRRAGRTGEAMTVSRQLREVVVRESRAADKAQIVR